MTSPEFVLLCKSYLSGEIGAQQLEDDFLKLRYSYTEGKKVEDFDTFSPVLGLAYDLIFSLVDRLYLGSDLDEVDVPEDQFRKELQEIIYNIDNNIPQKIPVPGGRR